MGWHGPTWRAIDGKQIAVLRRRARVASAKFDQSGTRIVTASEDQEARVWDGADGRLLNVLKGHAGSLTRGDFNPDRSMVLTASDDGTQTGSTAIVATLRFHNDEIYRAAERGQGRLEEPAVLLQG
jgi:WD40 repeat protein